MIKKRYKEFLRMIEVEEEYYDLRMSRGTQFTESSTGSWGGFHVYEKNDEFVLDFCERGRIYPILRSKSWEDIYVVLVKNILFQVAVDYELKNRVETQSVRRIIFIKHLELFDRYIPNYTQKQREYYETILKVHSYDDGFDFKALVRKVYNDWDPVGLLSMGCPTDEYDSEIKDLTERLDNQALCLDFIMEQFYKVGIKWFGDSYTQRKEDGRDSAHKIIMAIKKGFS